MKRSLRFIASGLILWVLFCWNPKFGKGVAPLWAENKPEATWAYDLPSRPVFNPSTVFLKTGRKLNCDYAWREGETVFLVVRDRQIAVGYNLAEIDRRESPAAVPEPARIEERAAIDRSAAEDLYQISGMAAVVEQLAASYLSGLAEQEDKLPPALYRALCQAGAGAFGKHRIGETILSRLQESFDAALFRDVMEWLRSPLGRKITALESEAAGPEGSRRMQSYARGLQTDPPSRQRVELEERFEAATGSSDKAADILMLSALGAAVGMDAAHPAENRLGAARIRQQVDQQRPQIVRLCRNLVRILFFYTYQTIAEPDLQKYVEFAESQPGRQYHERTFAAFREAMADAAVESGKRVVEVLNETALKKKI